MAIAYGTLQSTADSASFTYQLTAGTQYQFFVDQGLVFTPNGTFASQVNYSRITLYNPDGTVIGTYGAGTIGTNTKSVFFPNEAALYFIPTTSGAYKVVVASYGSVNSTGNFSLNDQLVTSGVVDPKNGNAVIVYGNYATDTVSVSGSTVSVLTPTSNNEPQIINNASRVEFGDGTLVITGTGTSARAKFFTGVFTNASTINGNSGNDTFTAGDGNKTFNGGGGHDSLVFSGTSGGYALTKNADNSVTIVDSTTNRDGTNVTAGVEHLQFTDKTLFVEGTNNANVARLYSAAFNRQPDVSGLNFWEDIYANNVSTSAKNSDPTAVLGLAVTVPTGASSSIAQSFIASAEFQSKYGALSDAAYVTQLYANVLGRVPDAGGLSYWVGLLGTGGAGARATVLVDFAESVENIANAAYSAAHTGGWLFAV